MEGRARDNRHMKRALLFFPGVYLAIAACAMAAAPVRVLVIDGFGNHDWQRTTRLIRAVLDGHDGFRVVVTTAPDTDAEPLYSAWSPDFSHCDVVIQTCNDINGSGPLWPEKVRQEFENFIASGGGMFAFHSANNAFPQWPAYNRMLGLAWRDRNTGTAIRIRPDESLERIPPGSGASTSHGARTDRSIHLLGNHPIHSGLPRVWMTPLIEVYTHARGPAENLDILSWAEDPATGGRWPIEWTVTYGKGRVYTSTFGHVWKDEADPVDLRCAGFQTLLVRAIEWLARREVTLPVPADFPTASAVSLRPLPEP